MFRLPQNNWPDTAAGRGVLFFVQLVNDMLSPETFESFRALSLDTLARISEAIQTVEDIQLDRVPKAVIDPIIGELSWSLGKDPIAKLSHELEIAAVIRNLNDPKRSLSDKARNLRLLQCRLAATYKQSIEKAISDCFVDSKQRVRLRILTGFYCSHLLNLGYSREYILRVLNEEYLSADVQRVRRQALSRFFRRFDCSQKQITVITPLSDHFAAYLKNLGLKYRICESVNELPTMARLEFANSTATAFIVQKNRSFDEEGAAARAQQELSSVAAIAHLAPKVTVFDTSSAKYAFKAQAGNGVHVASRNVFNSNLDVHTASGRRIKDLRSYTRRILTSFDDASKERVLSSISTSSLARKSPSPEIQLISIWSAIEVLLSAPEGTARILHYVDGLLPCICLRYIRRQFVAVHDALFVLHRRKFSDLVNNELISGATDSHTKFAAILMLPPHANLRQSLLNLCTDNPLALHRLWKLHDDFGNPKNLANAVGAHQKRVEWQIHRIYRARNNLVHAGRVPSFLDSLILNLFEYYRSTVATIVKAAHRDEKPANIDQVVSDIRIEYQIFEHLAQRMKEK